MTAFQVVHAETGKLVEFFRNRLLLIGRQRIAFKKRSKIFGACKFFYRSKKGIEIGRLLRKCFVVISRSCKCREIGYERQFVGRPGVEKRSHVRGVRKEHNTIEENRIQQLEFKITNQDAAPESSITFPGQVFRRIPPFGSREISPDKISKDGRILINSPVVFVLLFPKRVTVSSAHRIYEDEIGILQERSRIVH